MHNRDYAEKAFDEMVYGITCHCWSYGDLIKACAEHVRPSMAQQHLPGPAARLYFAMVEADRESLLTPDSFNDMQDHEIAEWMAGMDEESPEPNPVAFAIVHARGLKSWIGAQIIQGMIGHED